MAETSTVPAFHLTKVAVGCKDLRVLADRLAERAANGETTAFTRYRPKRAEELAGGSLFWIIAHKLVARQAILGFDATPDGQRTIIRLDVKLVEVAPRPLRAHQGWRYLAAADAPSDLANDVTGIASLPPELREALAQLALV